MAQDVILVIMDGWGIGAEPEASAIAQAATPFVNSLLQNYPNATLKTDGEAVGLPDGQMGNSEVGHLNLGAGRVVYQELLRINRAIESDDLRQNASLKNTFNYAKREDKALHLMGLVSNGGIHSHINHLKALCTYAAEEGLTKVFIHAFTDGRDTDPKSGIGFINELNAHLAATTGQIASVIGRYYAMDRDLRWERTKKAYDLLIKGKGKGAVNLEKAIQHSYDAGVTDEFILPIVKTDEGGAPIATIRQGDAVICFNFRTDRCRQITRVLTQDDLPEHDMKTLPLHFTTMTMYDRTFRNVHNVFEYKDLAMTLGEVLEKAGRKQIRVAETEKYPHVTFFFSGGREKPFEGENRILVASPKVATYDLKPEMSAYEVTDSIMKEIEGHTANFICLNYANPDMVGHTGVFEAAVKAVETVDKCMSALVPKALEQGYAIIVIADHGNADYMVNPDGSPNTAHTKNPVPCILVSNDRKHELKSGKLADIAPTILTLMRIQVPPQMTGEVLLT